MAVSSYGGDKPWVLRVHDLLQMKLTAGQSRQHSVCRVPRLIRELKPDVYQHRIIPLGLYSRDLCKVTRTDELKLEVASVVLKHRSDLVEWNAFCAEVAEFLPSPETLCKFYVDSPSDWYITDEVVLSVLTVDTVFIAALFWDIYRRRLLGEDQNFPEASPYFQLDKDIRAILKRPEVRCDFEDFECDLWTHENQIPRLLIWNIFDVIEKNPADLRARFPMESKIVLALLSTSGLPYPDLEPGDIGENFFDSCDHLLACLYKVVCIEKRWRPSSGCLEHCGAKLLKMVKKLVQTVKKLLKVDKILQTVKELLKVAKIPNKRRCSFPRFERNIPTVSQLHKAAVSVRRNQTGVSNIRFVKSVFGLKATLYLPRISLHDKSERLLLNMCVYEYMNTNPEKKPFMAYLQVMDDLINTEEDVKLLRKGDEPVIICNLLGEDKLVADIFNNPLKGFTAPNDELFKGVKKEIHDWYNTRWKHQFSHLVELFEQAPWTFVTMVVATLLLIATILQTLYAMHSYYHG